jgi:hypothetical protein
MLTIVQTRTNDDLSMHFNAVFSEFCETFVDIYRLFIAAKKNLSKLGGGGMYGNILRGKPLFDNSIDILFVDICQRHIGTVQER